MFITNNHASFHLWLKENSLKHENISKYYENVKFCFLCLYQWLQLLKAVIFIDCNFLYLFKSRPKVNFKVFHNEISTSVKRSEKQLASKANSDTFLAV